MDSSKAIIIGAGQPVAARCVRCGQDVNITAEMRSELMASPGGQIAHEVCPTVESVVLRNYSIEVRIGIDRDEEPHSMPLDDERVETLAWFRIHASAPSAFAAMPHLEDELRKKWESVVSNIHLVELPPVTSDTE